MRGDTVRIERREETGRRKRARVERLLQEARWSGLVLAGLAEHLLAQKRSQESEAAVWAAYRVLRWISEAERCSGQGRRRSLARAAETNLALRGLVLEWAGARPSGRRLIEELWSQSRKVGVKLRAVWDAEGATS